MKKSKGLPLPKDTPPVGYKRLVENSKDSQKKNEAKKTDKKGDKKQKN